MTKSQAEIDRRPFQSKADRERELPLQAQYHNLAIPAVVAAIQQAGASKSGPKTQIG